MRLETQTAPAPSTELATIGPIQSIVPADFFKPGGSADVLSALKDEVRKQAAALDISTEQNRAALASLAYKVARSKTALDEQGKKLTEGLRKQKAEVDAERGKVWDEMEALQKEVRQPLTDWENAEKERIAGHEAALHLIQDEVERATIWDSITEIRDAKRRVEAIYEQRDWQEFATRGAGMKALAFEALKMAFEHVKAALELKAEQERQKAEAAEKAIRAREEAAAKAAKEAAERKAEEQARLARESAERERQRVENERAEAEAKARQAEAQRVAEQQLAARLLEEAAERRLQEIAYAEEKRIAYEKETKRQLELAEMRRIAEEQAAQRRAQEAAEKAERDRLAAIEAERQRVADEARRVAEEAEKRAKNRAHQASVNREILAALESLLIPEGIAKNLISAIAKGSIPHVKVEY